MKDGRVVLIFIKYVVCFQDTVVCIKIQHVCTINPQ